jgi:hypothetical protein
MRKLSARLFDDYLFASWFGLAAQTQLNVRENTQSSGRSKPSQTARLSAPRTAASSVPEHPLRNEEPKSNASVNGPVVLSPEQKKVLQMVNEGRNVFFTGSAGLHFACMMSCRNFD